MDALNNFVGPSGENGRYDQWNQWTAWFWIRLEDCTGQYLGALPQDDEYEDESTDESGDERSDDYDTVMMTMTTVGNGYVNLMKRSLSEDGGFPHSWKATVVPGN